MIDRTTQLLAASLIADRHAEARARRLADEARGGSERSSWLTVGTRAFTRSGGALLTRVRRVRVEPGTTLSPARNRA
jgi:hypothetical protein